MAGTIFEAPPMWVVFIASVVLFLVATEVGFRVGIRRREKAAAIESGSTGIVTGSILGLVSFLLAFSFGISATNFSERRGVVLDEANAIGTTYLRSDLLPQEAGDTLKTHLETYTQIRVDVAKPGTPVRAYFTAIRASEELHAEMWSVVVPITRQNPTAANALVVSAINDVIDLHSTRVAVGVRHTIPNSIWIALYLVSVVALATTGYRFGASFNTRSELLPAMVISFACVVTLIADLDNPRHGFLLNDQSPMRELLAAMRSGSN